MASPSIASPEALRNDGSLEALLTPNIKKTEDVLNPSTTPFLNVKSLLVHVLLLILASVFFILWINSIYTSCPLDPLLTYSPVTESVQYVEKRFDNSMNLSTSVFRGPPGPALDAAWTGVTLNVPATRLTREQFLMADGIDTTAAVQYPPEDGGGYMAQIDGYHNIHCLDMLRKYVRRDYYAGFDPAFNGKLRFHLGHCTEAVRQKLMCTVDLTMISYNWVRGVDEPVPNLSATHQCLDFDRILDWSYKHNAYVPKGHVVKPENATELPEYPM